MLVDGSERYPAQVCGTEKFRNSNPRFQSGPDLPKRGEPSVWSVIVYMSGSWYCGPRRFATEEDAREWGEQFYQSHPSVKEWKAVPASGANGNPKPEPKWHRDE